MGDLQEMKDLVEIMVKQSVEAQKRADRMAEQNANLIATLNAHGGGDGHVGVAPALDAGLIRSENISKLNLALRMSGKVKDFKETHDGSVKEWLKRFDQEIGTLKRMSGIDDELTRNEIVELFKDKLDYPVIKRLDTAFTNRAPIETWDAIIYNDLQKVMREEYGSKVADVCEVILQFGPSRLKKTPEMSVAKFAHL